MSSIYLFYKTEFSKLSVKNNVESMAESCVDGLVCILIIDQGFCQSLSWQIINLICNSLNTTTYGIFSVALTEFRKNETVFILDSKKYVLLTFSLEFNIHIISLDYLSIEST